MNYEGKIYNGETILKPLEIAVIKTLILFDGLKAKGWVFAKEIPDRKHFTSQSTNIYKYTKRLIKMGVVQKKWKHYKDNRNMPRKKIMYRLELNFKNYVFIKKVEQIIFLKPTNSYYFKLMSEGVVV